MVTPVVERSVPDRAVQVVKRLAVDGDVGLQEPGKDLVQHVLGCRAVVQQGNAVGQQNGTVLLVERQDLLPAQLCVAHIRAAIRASAS